MSFDTKPWLKTQAQVGLMHAITGKLIALNNGDAAKVVEQDRYISSFRKVLLELDARGTKRKFLEGQKVELQTVGDDGVVAGWASTPDMDACRHVVANGAFTQSIRERGLTGPKSIKLLLDHEWTRPAGVIRTLEYRTKGLWIEAQLDLNVEYVRDRYSLMKMIEGFNFSVAFMLEEFEVKQDRDKVEYLQVNRGDLYEVSLVAFPCNAAAQTTTIKGQPATGGMTAKLQEMLEILQRANRAL